MCFQPFRNVAQQYLISKIKCYKKNKENAIHDDFPKLRKKKNRTRLSNHKTTTYIGQR